MQLMWSLAEINYSPLFIISSTTSMVQFPVCFHK